MISRLAYRGATFNIPSNRLLWLSLGKYDSLVEYQEVAGRLMLYAYNPAKVTFRDYLIRVSYYPALAIPQPKASLNFDDFILCTANVKNIADEMTRGLLPHINWVKLVIANIDKWVPKHKRFIAEGRLNRLKSAISTSVFSLFGYKLSANDVDTIVGSLE